MVKQRVMLPVEDVDLKNVKYKMDDVSAPHVTGIWLKLFTWMIEAPVLGSLIVHLLMKKNGVYELLRDTVIPDLPMFKPEYSRQELESGTQTEDGYAEPGEMVESALRCLPHYDPGNFYQEDPTPFRYWRIRDYAHAYRSNYTSPSLVADRIISVMEDFRNIRPPAPLLISFDQDDLKKQAAASTCRFEEGKPLSILDGIFMAIKDDIDLLPYPTKGGTTWYDQVWPTTEDAACVSSLRKCGVIFVGKANMHEMGMGTTGNNANYGTPRNPHASDRYTGGSSSGPAALVASGICSAALGTDGGGSVRIPSSICGVVGLKTTFGRVDMTGSLCDGGTVVVIGPIASSVEDAVIVYAAISRANPERSVPFRSFSQPLNGTVLRLGKYSEWFNDVYSREISRKCDDVLDRLRERCSCSQVEITIPELHEMRIAHLVSIGSDASSSLHGKATRLTHDVRTSMSIFRSFTSSDYIAAQRVRRRAMHHHMRIFERVDVIVTPTTGMTAPRIPAEALQCGESDLKVAGNLMRFVIAGNLLGFPAISVPVGYDEDNLPIGLQLIGPPWAEPTLLRLAFAVQELCAEAVRKPASFFDVLKEK